ncbi:6744_t:CDS:2 [Funneliformis geosporum]|uniref:6744_t:CDS:1 n=1 Tax=Funneliformis geosporum TaxID=1117311 RepID=A0A9W4SUU7_9GLOM|nr:6744_t:CDS:2 [Funneliformis geosporum]
MLKYLPKVYHPEKDPKSVTENQSILDKFVSQIEISSKASIIE